MFKVKNPGLFAAGMGMLAGATPQQGFSNAMSAYGTMDQVRHRREQEAFRRQQMEQAAAMEAQQRQQQQQAQNATLEFLRGKVPEDQFQLAQANPQVRLELFKRAMGGNAAEQAKFGLSPVMGVDANGNPVMMQMSNQGGVRPVELPEGVQIQNKPIQVDAGTHTIFLDPITRQQVGMIPKNLAQAEQQKVEGKRLGEARADYSGAIEQADQSIALIDQMLIHPGREAATGLSSWNPLNRVPGTAARDFNVMGAQLQGKAFLEAFESLKGGGQITEVEGRKATEAIARLDTAQSEEAYKAALLELRSILEAGKRRAASRAGMGQQPFPADLGQMGQQAAPAESGNNAGEWREVAPGVRVRQK